MLHGLLHRLGQINVAALGQEAVGDHMLVGRGHMEGAGGDMNQVHPAIQQLCKFHLIFKGKPS